MKTASISKSELIDCKYPIYYIINKLRQEGFHISPISGSVEKGCVLTTDYDPINMVYNYREGLDE